MTKRAGIYCRISQADPRVPKVENQEADCRKLAAANGYEVTEVYVDDGISASKFLDRPGWVAMLRDIEVGKLGVLLATEEERFTRQVMEKEALQLACIKGGVTWHTARGGVVDPATADGEFFSGMRGLMGRMESRRKAERMKGANASRRAKGQPPSNGPRPFGWLPDRLTLDEPAADLIREGTAMILAGRSLNAVVEQWRKSDVRPPRAETWNRIAVRTVLSRWRNAAVVSYMDEPVAVPAQWQAIVSRQDVEDVRAILSNPGARKVATRMLSGIANCHCGTYLFASGANGGRYVCSARATGLAVEWMPHIQIKAEILDRLARKAIIDQFFLAAHQGMPSFTDAAEKLAELHARLAQVRRARDDLGALAGEPGFLATARRRIAALAADEAALTGQIEEHAKANAHAAMIGEIWQQFGHRSSILDQVKLKRDLAARFDGLGLDQRRALAKSLLRITVHPGKTDDRVQIEHLAAPFLDEEEGSAPPAVEPPKRKASRVRARGGYGEEIEPLRICGVVVDARTWNILTHRTGLRGEARERYEASRRELADRHGIDTLAWENWEYANRGQLHSAARTIRDRRREAYVDHDG